MLCETPVVSASFNRDDSASILGSADTGQPFEILQGIWGVTKGRAYASSGTTAIAVIETGLNHFKLFCNTKGTIVNVGIYAIPGVIFHVLDLTHYLYVRLYNNLIGLLINEGAGPTVLQESPYPCADNAEYVINVTSDKQYITVGVNGVNIFTYDLAGKTGYKYYTKVGMRLGMSVSPAYIATWDDLNVWRL